MDRSIPCEVPLSLVQSPFTIFIKKKKENKIKSGKTKNSHLPLPFWAACARQPLIIIKSYISVPSLLNSITQHKQTFWGFEIFCISR
uniref:Uncharacterized protein n=1 Tax=Rhizophora mucronata TaxID=61149 RepID=A0A2P2N8H3_RHIMU